MGLRSRALSAYLAKMEKCFSSLTARFEAIVEGYRYRLRKGGYCVGRFR
jgi:hypothetical protein